ncbi:MAG: hypothetical protein V2A58_13360 [Planctomycetota bacterium]
MTGPKIAMVGGGSVNWGPGLVRDILSVDELASAEIRLLDLDRKAAELVAEVGRRCARQWGLGVRFTATTDTQRALDGADAVIITISTGGLDAMTHDLGIPEAYAIFQTVGDTVGPGGWARGLRNIPVFVGLAREISRCCPRAAVLNYTNPMGTLTKTLALLTKQPVVGLCHGLFECYHHLMKIFKLDREEEIRARYCGINHFFWILDFTVRGKPGYRALARKLAGGKRLDDLLREAYVDEAGHSSPRRLVTSELFETFGYLPYFGDRHTCEFFGRYITGDKQELKKHHLHRTTIAERRRLRQRARATAERLARGKGELCRSRSRETAADIAAARWTGREFVDVMNLPNNGQVSNLPAGAVVETPGIASASGFSAVACGEMPSALVAVTMPHVVNQELIVEAGIEGDLGKAFAALVNDPACSHLSVAQVKDMGRKLLEAHRQYLPQFFGRRRRP